MQIRIRQILCSLFLLGLAVGVSVCAEPAAKESKSSTQKDVPLEWTRKTVRMLDDVYKTTIVRITEKYVADEDDFPPVSAAIAGDQRFRLFGDIQLKGFHEVRVLDATGKPIRETNAPSDDFEKNAVTQLKSGKHYYEQIVTLEGKRYLRAATPIDDLPMHVMKKCVMCHPNYADVKPGQPTGVLSYNLPIDETP